MELKIEVAEVSGLREEVSKLPELQASLGEALTEIDAHGTALEDRIERTESSLTRALAKLREEWEGQSSEAAAAVEAAGTQLSALETRTAATESALEGVTARCDSQESAAEGVAARCDALDAQCSEALAAAQDGSAQEELSARVESLGEEVAAAASGAAGAISAAREASSAAAGQQEHERLATELSEVSARLEEQSAAIRTQVEAVSAAAEEEKTRLATLSSEVEEQSASVSARLDTITADAEAEKVAVREVVAELVQSNDSRHEARAASAKGLEERLEELSGNTEAALASAQDAIGQLTKRQHLEAVGELIGGVDKNVHVLQEEVAALKMSVAEGIAYKAAAEQAAAAHGAAAADGEAVAALEV